MTPEHTPTIRRRLAAIVAGATLLAACGGRDAPADPADDPDGRLEVADDDTLGELDVDDDALADLDEGQLEILDEVLDDGFDDADDADEAAPWNGIRLVVAGGSALVETIDTAVFSGVTRLVETPIDDPRATIERNGRLIDTSVVAGGAIWVNGEQTLHRVSLDDGSITATVSIDDVLPGGDFGDITGDDAGVYATASVPGGADVVVEVDPSTGEVRSTTDLTNETVSLLTIASSDTHVAVAYDSAPGIPVRVIDRASGAVTDIGDYLELHEVHFVRGELWVVVSSNNVNEPGRYEKFSVDGTSLGGAQLPRRGVVRVFGDRAVVVEPSNRTDPDAPVVPIEVEPVGTPIEELLPDTMVTLTAFAEIGGLAVSSGSCCLRDDADFPVRTAIVDVASGETVFVADSFAASAILPPG